MKTPPTAACSMCGGSGQVRRYWRWWGWQFWPRLWRLQGEICPRCHGLNYQAPGAPSSTP